MKIYNPISDSYRDFEDMLELHYPDYSTDEEIEWEDPLEHYLEIDNES